MLRRRSNFDLNPLRLSTQLPRLLILLLLTPRLPLPARLLLHQPDMLLPRLRQALAVDLELDPQLVDPSRGHEVGPADAEDEGEAGAYEGTEGEDERGYDYAE